MAPAPAPTSFIDREAADTTQQTPQHTPIHQHTAANMAISPMCVLCFPNSSSASGDVCKPLRYIRRDNRAGVACTCSRCHGAVQRCRKKHSMSGAAPHLRTTLLPRASLACLAPRPAQCVTTAGFQRSLQTHPPDLPLARSIPADSQRYPPHRSAAGSPGPAPPTEPRTPAHNGESAGDDLHPRARPRRPPPIASAEDAGGTDGVSGGTVPGEMPVSISTGKRGS